MSFNTTAPRTTSAVRIAALLAALAAAGRTDEIGCTFELEKLLMPGGAANDYFGGSASMDGETAVVGAYLDDDKGTDSGSANVLVRNGSAWAHQAKLVPSNGAPGDRFGIATSVRADTAIVGAYLDNTGFGTDAGSAYAFVRDGTAWSQQQQLLPPDGAGNDRFGLSVSLSGNTAVVGAHLDDDNGTDSGSAYVFVFDGTAWNLEAKLLPNDGAAEDYFGLGVSVSGDRVIIGAFGDDPAGSAYVFSRTGTTWKQEAKVFPNTSDSARFATSVSLSGDTALVGAYEDDLKGTDAGAAYVFVRASGSIWIEEQKLVACGGGAGDRFGLSVSVENNTAVIGSDLDDDMGSNAGLAHVFTRAGTVWTERSRLLARDGAADDQFGYAVATSGGRAVVGAVVDDNSNGANAGAAYVYEELGDPIVTYCTAKAGLICGTPAMAFSGTPSATQSSGFVLSAQPARSGKSGVFIYTNNGRNNATFQGGTLCVFPSIRRSVPVDSGGSTGCDGVFMIDWNAFTQGALGGNPQAFLRSIGQQVNVQTWGRDSIPTGSFLSDAVEYFVCP